MPIGGLNKPKLTQSNSHCVALNQLSQNFRPQRKKKILPRSYRSSAVVAAAHGRALVPVIFRVPAAPPRLAALRCVAARGVQPCRAELSMVLCSGGAQGTASLVAARHGALALLLFCLDLLSGSAGHLIVRPLVFLLGVDEHSRWGGC